MNLINPTTMTPEELRENLITLDFRGKDIKEACLRELIRRARQEERGEMHEVTARAELALAEFRTLENQDRTVFRIHSFVFGVIVGTTLVAFVLSQIGVLS